MAQVSTIPPQAVDRFAHTFDEFVTTLRTALPLAPEEHAEVSRWQKKALPLLNRDLDRVNAAAKSYTAGDAGPLVQAASSALSLAKDLDGFSLSFAGEETARQLEEKLRFVVMAAWQVVSANHA